MKVLVYGAGVIGQVYGGRLIQAGHAVTMLARAPASGSPAARGIALRAGDRTRCYFPPIVTGVTKVAGRSAFDAVLVCVRDDQLASVLPGLARIRADQVVFLLNHCTGLTEVRDLIGPGRALFGFPGVGGERTPDGAIEYTQIRQQKTTLERDGTVADMMRDAGFPVDVHADMDGWLKTHAVFITATGAAILAAGGDSDALAGDRARVSHLVAAVGEGFAALARQGVAVAPRPLRLIFTAVPRFAAVRYWQAQLRGPLGTLAIAPHIRATQDTEFPILATDVRKLVAAYGPTPHLDSLLTGV